MGTDDDDNGDDEEDNDVPAVIVQTMIRLFSHRRRAYLKVTSGLRRSRERERVGAGDRPKDRAGVTGRANKDLLFIDTPENGQFRKRAYSLACAKSSGEISRDRRSFPFSRELTAMTLA